jgi:hypothetical protein
MKSEPDRMKQNYSQTKIGSNDRIVGLYTATDHVFGRPSRVAIAQF